jgi:hypothetical protein
VVELLPSKPVILRRKEGGREGGREGGKEGRRERNTRECLKSIGQKHL